MDEGLKHIRERLEVAAQDAIPEAHDLLFDVYVGDTRRMTKDEQFLRLHHKLIEIREVMWHAIGELTLDRKGGTDGR